MDDDEKQLDEYLARTNEQKPDETPSPTDEDIVEQKARENGPLKPTILQRRSTLSDQQIEQHIAATLRKYPEQIDEMDLRQALASKEEQNGQVSEADYARAVNDLLARREREQAAEAETNLNIAPPAAITNAIGTTKAAAGRAMDWGSSLPTPGGVGLMVLALIFFVWVVVPVSNGRTRLQLLWGVITNQVDFLPLPGHGGGNSFGTFDTPAAATTAATTAIVPSTQIYPSFEVL